jgi:hypothetical protein
MPTATIRKVWERRRPHQLIVSIPTDIGIKAGDFVSITLVNPELSPATDKQPNSSIHSRITELFGKASKQEVAT